MERYDQKLLEKAPGVKFAIYRMAYRWMTAKKPRKNIELFEAKALIAYFVFTRLPRLEGWFIGGITRYYPFSLLWPSSLFHAGNAKVRLLMRGMEDVAQEAGIPVYINNGNGGRDLSVLYGKFERGGINKERAVKKLQELFQDKFGTVYVQEQEVGFRVLVDTRLI